MGETPLAERARVTHAAYGSGASHYRDLWAPQIHSAGRALVQAMGLPETAHVLDLGAGVGTLLPVIGAAAPSGWVVAADRVPAMIALAPPGFPRVVLDGAHLPFATGTFDAVVAAFMLFHLEDPVQGLSGARRILRPRGIAGATTWGTENPSLADDILEDELDRHPASAAQAGLAQHELMDTPDKVEDLFEAAGYGSVKVRVDRWESQPDAAEFIRLRANVGRSARRLNQLDAGTRRAVLRRVDDRLRELRPSDFYEWAEVICAVAVAA